MDEPIFFWGMLAGVLMFVVLLFLGAFALSSLACETKAQAMGVEYQWGPILECVIKIDGQWVPLKNYRKLDK